MNSSSLRSPWEHLTGENDDLGDGLFSAELYFWAERKRQQNLPHALAGHSMCRTCKNCLCGKPLSPNFGFRCICADGKTYVTPYRIRFRSERDRDNHHAGLVYCLTHQIMEPRGPHADASN